MTAIEEWDPTTEIPHPADTAPAAPVASNGHKAPTDTTAIDDWRDRIIDGATFLMEGDDHPEALWGDADAVLWASQQPLVIAGPQGAGKTVFGQRLTLGHVGLVDELLGWPVAPGDDRVLYLAADRPEQARLSMRRMVRHDQMDLLADRLRVWRGPPPYDLARSPGILLEMAAAAGARKVVLDSLKDVALKISDDEIGAAVNRAIQLCIADGIDVCSLHHPRKLGGDDRADKPRSLDDLYGSVWLTAGAGSVIYLGPGEGGAHDLVQLKSPIGLGVEVKYEHDHTRGGVGRAERPDLLAIVTTAGPEGITTEHAARCLHRVDVPGEKERKATSRRLGNLEKLGLVEKIPSSGVGAAVLWVAVP